MIKEVQRHPRRITRLTVTLLVANVLAIGVGGIDLEHRLTSTLQAENIHASGNVAIDGVVTVDSTPAGGTSTITKIDGAITGTANTAAGNLQFTGLSGRCAATKTGAGNLTCVGVYGQASSATSNYAGLFDGDVQANGQILSTQRILGFGSPSAFYSNAGWIQDAGSAPVVTACGTSPAITAGSYSGVVTEGTTATGCVLTFAVGPPGGSLPSCVVTSRSGLAFSYVVTATAITITNIGALSSTKLDFHCAAHA